MSSSALALAPAKKKAGDSTNRLAIYDERITQIKCFLHLERLSKDSIDKVTTFLSAFIKDVLAASGTDGVEYNFDGDDILDQIQDIMARTDDVLASPVSLISDEVQTWYKVIAEITPDHL